MKPVIKDFQNKLHLIYMYCSPKEKEALFSIVNNSTYIIYEVKNANSESLADVIETYNHKTAPIIDKFIKDFKV